MTEKPATQSQPLPVVPERTENDEVMDSLRPYLTQVGLFVVLGLLGLIAVTLFINNRQQSAAQPWQELTSAQSEFAISGNVDRLTQVASAYPDTPAAMWALQSAGDYQLRRGIDQLRESREKGFAMIEESKESFQQILDAPSNAKSPDIQQASVFSMAYASESLGEFDEAAKYYTQLIEEAPESHFIDAAKRGVARSTNPEFAAAFEKFKSFEEIGDAPGPNVPDRPEIEFPEFEMPEETEAGDEVSGDNESADASGEGTEVEQPEVKTVETESAETAEAKQPDTLNGSDVEAATEAEPTLESDKEKE